MNPCIDAVYLYYNFILSVVREYCSCFKYVVLFKAGKQTFFVFVIILLVLVISAVSYQNLALFAARWTQDWIVVNLNTSSTPFRA